MRLSKAVSPQARKLRLGLPLLMAGVSTAVLAPVAQAQCVIQPGGTGTPGNIGPNSAVLCSNPNSGETLVSTNGGSQVFVDLGATLDNSFVSLTGDEVTASIFSGASTDNSSFRLIGQQAYFDLNGSMTNSAVVVGGDNSQLIISGTYTTNANALVISGTDSTFSLFDTGQFVGTNALLGAPLITGDFGRQVFNLHGTITAPNAHILAAGTGDDLISLTDTTTLNGAALYILEGGDGNDTLHLTGSNSAYLNLVDIETLVMDGASSDEWGLYGTGNLSTIQIARGVLRTIDISSLGANADMFIASGGRFFIQNTAINTYNGDLSGDGTFEHGGNSLLALGGNNVNFTGRLFNSEGTLLLLNQQAAGNGFIENDGSLVTGDFELFNNVSGTGGVIKTGAGVGALTGENTYSGGTQVAEGTLRVTGSGALGTGDVDIVLGATLNIDNTLQDAFGLGITGDGGLLKTGTATLIFSQGNSFTGGTRIDDGVMVLNHGGGLGTGDVENNATLRIGDIAFANDVSGTGTLQKTSTGIGELTGANTYTGGTEIIAGILRVAGDEALGTGNVDVGAGAALWVQNGAQEAFANTITGDGGLFKSGVGELILSGANTYAGGTEIMQGTVVLNHGQALGTGQVLNDSTLRIGNVSVANAIGGSGIVQKTSSGLGELTGTNTYSGGTQIMGGTLRVAGDAALGTGAVDIAAGARLEVLNQTQEAFANLITGDGELRKDGAGELILSTANTYTGGTQIVDGTLVLNHGDALGTGDVNNSAVLRVGNIALANNVAGSGSIEKTSTGLAELRGTNTFSGGLNILQGGVAVSSGASLGTGDVDVSANAGLFLVTTAGAASMSNAVTGAGAVVRSGAGTFAMNGTSTYSGGTQIDAGSTLIAGNGQALGTGGVFNNGVLQIGDFAFANVVSGTGVIRKTGAGTATLTATNTHTGGLDQSGNAIMGAVNANAGSLFRTVGSGTTLFNSGTFGNVELTGGIALLDGTITVAGANGLRILNGARLAGDGTITGSVTNSGLLTPGDGIGALNISGGYTQNATGTLEIQFDGTGGVDLLNIGGAATLNGGTLRLISTDGAEGQGATFMTAAGGITGAFGTVETIGANLPLMVVYTGNSAQMFASVVSARPSTFNSQIQATSEGALSFVNFTARQAGSMKPGSGVWGGYFGAETARSQTGSALPHRASINGAAGGYEATLDNGVRLGVAVGLSTSDIGIDRNAGGGSIDAVLASAYGAWDIGGSTVLSGGLVFGSQDHSTLRSVAFGGATATLEGDASSTLFGAFANIGSDIAAFDGWTMRGNVRGALMRQSLDGYAEGGSNPLRLAVDSADYDTGELIGGVVLSRAFEMSGGVIEPRFAAGARYLAAMGDRDIDVTFVQADTDVLLEGDDRSVTQAYAGLGARMHLSGNVTLDLDYTAHFGEEARDHIFEARLNYRF
jgi:fibronectin-binding autotransporter adhesin